MSLVTCNWHRVSFVCCIRTENELLWPDMEMASGNERTISDLKWHRVKQGLMKTQNFFEALPELPPAHNLGNIFRFIAHIGEGRW